MPTLSIDWELSPRIIIVDAPDTEITAQEIVDTLRDAEDDVQNTNYEKIVNASGKEDLGGGTLVGITVELQNAKIGFEDRTTVLESGTVTTPDTGGISLVDSTALFQTNSVAVGDLIVNETDGSYSSVASIVSETELKTTVLSGGTDNQYDSSDAYSVYDIFQCKISGGNTVAIDDVGASLDPVFPTFGTQVVISSSSSATLQNQADAEFSSFANQVQINTASGVAGTGRDVNNNLIGTRQAPSNNMTDAKSIADTRGINNFNLTDDLTLTSADLSSGYSFTADSPFIILSINPGADVTNCSASGLTVEGEFDGFNKLTDCAIGTVTDLSGTIEKCSFQTTVSLSGNTSLYETYSQVVGVGYPVITPGSISLIVRDHHGSMGIAGMTGGTASIGIYGGRLIIEASCTGGTIYARGEPYEILDNSTGTTVVDQTESEKVSYIRDKMLTVAKFIGLK